MLAADRLYNKYEYLASKYAEKIYDFEKLGMEKEDVVQELKLKIYVGIMGWIKKKALYLKGGYEPVPLVYYLKSVLNSKLKDMMGQISKESSMCSLSNSETTVDCGLSLSSFSKIDFLAKEIVINDIDLLHGMSLPERSCFCLYLKGFTIKKISTLYGHKLNVSRVINERLDYIKRYKGELLEENTRFTVIQTKES